MKEDFLLYIWQYYVRLQVKYSTEEGSVFVVLDKGIPNTDAGADISQVRIQMDGVEWSGNVELHTKSSHWQRHKHNEDAAYNNVLLHFVAEKDSEAYTKNNRQLPTFIFPELQKYYEIYQRTFAEKEFVYCEKYFEEVADFTKTMWLQRLVVERLEEKTQMVFRLLGQNNNDWEETTYQLLVRYLGQRLNGDAFEQLARKVPLQIVVKHRNSVEQLEALLFGQAGFLEEEKADQYYQKLQTEYRFLQAKYDLQPMEVLQWKFLRLRPANFPTLRIAQLAALLRNSHGIFSQILEQEKLTELMKIFSVEASDYWKKHYIFGEITKEKKARRIGKSLQNVLLINVVVPLLFAYSQYVGDEKWQEKALRILQELRAEKNHIVAGFERLGMQVQTAYSSQALYQLKQKYCNFRHCERCAIGHTILKEHYG